MKSARNLNLLAKLTKESLLIARLHSLDHCQSALLAPLKDCFVRQARVAFHCLQGSLRQVIYFLFETAEILLSQFAFSRFRCLVKAGYRGQIMRLDRNVGSQSFEVFGFGSLLDASCRRLTFGLILITLFVAKLE